MLYRPHIAGVTNQRAIQLMQFLACFTAKRIRDNGAMSNLSPGFQRYLELCLSIIDGERRAGRLYPDDGEQPLSRADIHKLPQIIQTD
jgi:hypothetical protein